jgi:hypothetical protein
MPLSLHSQKMEIVAQLVRAPDCGSGGRGFETPHSPTLITKKLSEKHPVQSLLLFGSKKSVVKAETFGIITFQTAFF